MIRRPPISTRTDTLFPYTTLFRSTFRALRKSGCLHCRHPKHLPRSALTSLQLAFSGWHMWNVRAAQGQTRCLLEEKKGHCRSEEHTSELQSLMRISYAVFCLKKKNNKHLRQQ